MKCFLLITCVTALVSRPFQKKFSLYVCSMRAQYARKIKLSWFAGNRHHQPGSEAVISSELSIERLPNVRTLTLLITERSYVARGHIFLDTKETPLPRKLILYNFNSTTKLSTRYTMKTPLRPIDLNVMKVHESLGQSWIDKLPSHISALLTLQPDSHHLPASTLDGLELSSPYGLDTW